MNKKKDDSITLQIHKAVDEYYSKKIKEHGMCPQGVDWNSRESQQIRFKQLMKIVNRNEAFVINDFGCGYGGLLGYLEEINLKCRYFGYDISKDMIRCAQNYWHGQPGAQEYEFVNSSTLRPADYTVASGIFNVKGSLEDSTWLEYTLSILDEIDRNSSQGFAFNMLTSYSDPEYMKPDLYYADPCFMFNYCKNHYASNVALLHDYKLYEFTLLVRKTIN